MTVAPTSLLAWREIQDSLPEARAKVLSCVRLYGPMTDREIARMLGWEINRVTPRRGELVDAGLLQLSGTKVNEKSGKPNGLWKVSEASASPAAAE